MNVCRCGSTSAPGRDVGAGSPAPVGIPERMKMASQLIGGAWKGVRLAKSNGSPSTTASNEGEPEPPANGSDDEAIGRDSETDNDTE